MPPSSSEATPRPIVLLPGLDGSGALFAPLLRALGPTVRATVVSYREERRLADYLATVERHLQEPDTLLIAESFSGPLALTVAARRPERVGRLVLCASFAVSPFRTALHGAPWIPRALLTSRALQSALLKHACLNGCRDHALLEHAASVLENVTAETLRNRLRILADVDARDSLARLRCPVLYLQARHDRIVSPAHTRHVIEALAEVTRVGIDGPHLLLQAAPQACARAILDFAA